MAKVKDWQWKCDYPGDDIKKVSMAGEQCGPACDAHPTCTHFTYNLVDRICYFKRSSRYKASVYSENNICGRVCGAVNGC